MQKWMRNTHLLLGVFSLPFMLMYGVSSVQMGHRKWFDSKPKVTNTSVQVAASEAPDARSLARVLMARGAMEGEIMRADSGPKGYQVRVMRPGTIYNVTYNPAADAAAIETSTSNFLFMLNRLHHVAGIRHDYAPLNWWGWILGLAGAMLIVLAATGIYLWFKMHGELVIGSILLAASLGYSVTLIVMMRTAQ